MILFHKGSHRENGSELRFLRRISHRTPGSLSPHISNTFRVFSDGLRPFCVFCGKNSPTSLPRLRPVNPTFHIRMKNPRITWGFA